MFSGEFVGAGDAEQVAAVEFGIRVGRHDSKVWGQWAVLELLEADGAEAQVLRLILQLLELCHRSVPVRHQLCPLLVVAPSQLCHLQLSCLLRVSQPVIRLLRFVFRLWLLVSGHAPRRAVA